MTDQSHPFNNDLPNGTLRRYQAKTLIVRPESADNRVFTVNKGKARICLIGPNREQTLGYLQPGSLFVTHTSAWVEAVTDCEVCSWPIQQIKQLFATDPQMAVNTLREVGKILQNAIDLVENFAFRSVESRLARYLLSESKQQQSSTVHLAGNMAVMASLLGTSRQNLSTLFNRLVKMEVISRLDRHHVVILNTDYLQKLTDELSAG